MDKPSVSVRRLAQRLLEVEAARQSASHPHAFEAVHVCEKLRIALTRLAGADAFKSLLQRALVLARAETPSVQSVTLKPDGSMEGLDALVADANNGGLEPAVSIIAHLLDLLVTFIGEPLMLRLVRQAWPDGSLDESH
jgi:hypothetical protein